MNQVDDSLQPNINFLLFNRLKVSQEKIAQVCHSWKITEMALFGSVLRDDFRADSDIDLLITFTPKHGWNLLDLIDLKAELETLFQREVDLLQKKELKNPYRKQEILSTYQVIYKYS